MRPKISICHLFKTNIKILSQGVQSYYPHGAYNLPFFAVVLYNNHLHFNGNGRMGKRWRVFHETLTFEWLLVIFLFVKLMMLCIAQPKYAEMSLHN